MVYVPVSFLMYALFCATQGVAGWKQFFHLPSLWKQPKCLYDGTVLQALVEVKSQCEWKCGSSPNSAARRHCTTWVNTEYKWDVVEKWKVQDKSRIAHSNKIDQDVGQALVSLEMTLPCQRRTAPSSAYHVTENAFKGAHRQVPPRIWWRNQGWTVIRNKFEFNSKGVAGKYSGNDDIRSVKVTINYEARLLPSCNVMCHPSGHRRHLSDYEPCVWKLRKHKGEQVAITGYCIHGVCTRGHDSVELTLSKPTHEEMPIKEETLRKMRGTRYEKQGTCRSVHLENKDGKVQVSCLKHCEDGIPRAFPSGTPCVAEATKKSNKVMVTIGQCVYGHCLGQKDSKTTEYSLGGSDVPLIEDSDEASDSTGEDNGHHDDEVAVVATTPRHESRNGSSTTEADSQVELNGTSSAGKQDSLIESNEDRNASSVGTSVPEYDDLLNVGHTGGEGSNDTSGTDLSTSGEAKYNNTSEASGAPTEGQFSEFCEGQELVTEATATTSEDDKYNESENGSTPSKNGTTKDNLTKPITSPATTTANGTAAIGEHTTTMTSTSKANGRRSKTPRTGTTRRSNRLRERNSQTTISTS